MVKYYLSRGMPAGKLLLGIPTYGRSWQLATSSDHGLHAPAVGKGGPGPDHHFPGVYTYSDVSRLHPLFSVLSVSQTCVPDLDGNIYLDTER